jgi:hypothetical protein
MTRARDLADGADKDITGTLTLDDIVLSNDMSVADNGKVQFGAGNDLQIYHDGSNSVIKDNGTGKLILDTDGTSIEFQKSGLETLATFNTDGAITLYHDNSAKLATTSTGVDVSSTDATVNFVSSRGVGATHTITTGGTNSGIFNITADTGGDIFLNAENKLFRNAAGSTEHMRITSGGNVGIGTSSPSRQLHINNASESNIRLQGGSDYAELRVKDADNAFSFHFGASERMRIDSSGDLLVGSTTNSTNSNLILTGATRWGVGTQSGGNLFYIVRDSDNVGQYMVNGATSWTATSDERVKDIIEPITDAVEKISSLRSVIGKYKADEENTRRVFLIAQDVQAVLPEAVNVQDDDIGTLGLQYTDIIPLLTAAIKEQQAKITALETQRADLETRLTALEAAE